MYIGSVYYVSSGILLGQNANSLLPTGGTGEHKVDDLRIRHTILGEHGYVLDGYHPDIWRPAVTNAEAWRKVVGILLCHRWNPVGDTFTFLPRTFLPKVFLGKKGRNGAYNGPQLLLENLALNETSSGQRRLINCCLNL